MQAFTQSPRRTGEKHGQVRWLRRCGYWVVALALLPPLLAHPTIFFATLCLGYLLCSPLLYERLQPMSAASLNVWVVLEAMLLLAIVLKLELAQRVAGSVLLTLLLCQLAEGGHRRFLLGAAAMCGSAMASLGASYALKQQVWVPALSFQARLDWSAVLSLGLLLFMALAFTHIGYERSVRLHRAKHLLKQRSEQLQRVNQRLVRYLPAELPSRVSGAPEQRLSLQRRWLTVVFVDLCDFSAVTRALEAEALALILNDYLTMLDGCCRAAAGSLSKVVGDGALVVFEPDESEPQRAVARRAVALCEALPARLAALHEEWQEQGLVTQVQYRAGIASGHCSIGDWGRERLDYTVIGDRVNMAARLQAYARPGTVLLDDATALLVADRVALTLVEPLVLKGMGTLQPYLLTATGLVDRAKGSAMVPSVSVTLEGNVPPGQAVSKEAK
ncbi:MAG: adenylate/guanylate cyclase domain-containing protein [Pseudomonadales bacterium]